MWQLNLNQTGWHRRVRMFLCHPRVCGFQFVSCWSGSVLTPDAHVSADDFTRYKNMTSEDLLGRFQGLNDAFIMLRCIYICS